jgi:hypothetical protein
LRKKLAWLAAGKQHQSTSSNSSSNSRQQHCQPAAYHQQQLLVLVLVASWQLLLLQQMVMLLHTALGLEAIAAWSLPLTREVHLYMLLLLPQQLQKWPTSASLQLERRGASLVWAQDCSSTVAQKTARKLSCSSSQVVTSNSSSSTHQEQQQNQQSVLEVAD